MQAPIHRDSRRAELAGDAMKFFYCSLMLRISATAPTCFKNRRRGILPRPQRFHRNCTLFLHEPYCFVLCDFALNFWLMFTPVAESSVPIYRDSSDSIGVLVKRDRYTRQSMNTRIGH